MATVAEIQEKLAEIATNNSEMATEIARVREVLVGIRDQLASAVTPEELAALAEQAGQLVTDTQAVEDSLRATE